VGTRYEDQPPELWAGPESLDPTPVWKQFLLIGLFLVIGLVLVGGVAVFAAAPQLVSPPALVPGDRLVLAASDVPLQGAAPKRIGAPLVDDAKAFWLTRISPTEIVALRAYWTNDVGKTCPVRWVTSIDSSPVRLYAAECDRAGTTAFFTEHGDRSVGAPRGMDRYLVSVSEDRVIVNLSRVIYAAERTSAPPSP
jgi:hypothetical protein